MIFRSLIRNLQEALGDEPDPQRDQGPIPGFQGVDAHPTDPKMFRSVHIKRATVGMGSDRDPQGRTSIIPYHVDHLRSEAPGEDIPPHGSKPRFDHGVNMNEL